MADQASDENINILLNKLMKDRFCSQQVNDLDACIQNYVLPNPTNSYIDQSLYRKGMKKCQAYVDVAKKCLNNSERQNIIIQAAVKEPQCVQERRALMTCRQIPDRDCLKESTNLIYCGMAFLIQRQRDRSGGRDSRQHL